MYFHVIIAIFFWNVAYFFIYSIPFLLIRIEALLFLFKFSKINSKCIYSTPLPWSGCNTRSFLEVEYRWFEFSFPSPRLVAISRLKSPVSAIYPYLIGKKRWIRAFLFGISMKLKCKQHCPQSELMRLTVMPRVSVRKAFGVTFNS